MGFKHIKYLASGSAISALNDSIGYARIVKLFSCFAKDFCQYEMSAFPPKADIGRRAFDVRSVPIVDLDPEATEPCDEPDHGSRSDEIGGREARRRYWHGDEDACSPKDDQCCGNEHELTGLYP